jgi:DNA-binding transcriptional MerR regulator
MELIRVSEAARQLGCSERWLRESERKSKIPKARRDLNGWRVYTRADIEQIREMLVPDRENNSGFGGSNDSSSLS